MMLISLYLICRLVAGFIRIISMVNLYQILCGICVDPIIIKITNGNTTNLGDCFFLREINTLLKFQKDCIQGHKIPQIAASQY